MTPDQLESLLMPLKCNVRGQQDASNGGHRRTLGALAQAFNFSEAHVLCECSLARSTENIPDLCVVDVEIGVHVFEMKSVWLKQVVSVDGGGLLQIRYSSGVKPINPINQVRSAMFQIKDTTAVAYGKRLSLRFDYWVVFPSFTREAWLERFGAEAHCPPEYLFADDLDPADLTQRLGVSDRTRGSKPVAMQPLDQLQCVWTAFGDNQVIYVDKEERPPRRPVAGMLGERLDQAAEAYKNLSPKQQELSEAYWATGPRVVRGVAGSGKTIVLANHIARNLQRRIATAHEGLFGTDTLEPRLLAVCFNRTLAPFIEKKIAAAYKQRTGKPVRGRIEVRSLNKLLFQLARKGLWHYRSAKMELAGANASAYLSELASARKKDPGGVERLLYDAIYVDEGQDFTNEELRLLGALCRRDESGEPRLYVFYDDAQNLYGRPRPVWSELGLNVLGGRSHVMTECYRNTRPIVEAALNVLYGTCATTAGEVPTRTFANLGQLQADKLIEDDNGFWRVRFAPRDGAPPKLSEARSRQHETELLVERVRWLVEEQHVRPQDVLVLSFERSRVRQLGNAILAKGIRGIAGIHNAFENKDVALCPPGKLTISTVASAKGYDAYCVLLASASEFPANLRGRVSFYVGCTRAIEYLEVFSYSLSGLAGEYQRVLNRLADGRNAGISWQ